MIVDQKAPSEVPVNLTAEQAMRCLKLLERTQIQGAEVPAYIDLYSALSALVSAAAPASPEANL